MDQLREWRERAGRSQADLAAALGIDRTSYLRIESGQRRLLASELGLICDALSLSSEERLEALSLVASAGKVEAA